MPWLNVDFWHVVEGPEHNPFNFFGLMQQLNQLPAAQRLIDRGIEYSDFLEQPQFLDDNQVFGEATRGRKVNLPGRLNIQTGIRGDLGVRADEAVDEAAYFLYDRRLRVLALQRQTMFRATAVSQLLRELGNTNFNLSAVLRPSAWNRVQRMETIGKVEVALQGPAHHPNFTNVMPSLNNMMDEAAEMNAVTVELTMSMGHSRRSLNTTRAKRLINLVRRDESLDKLRVSGKEEGADAAETVDFMNDKLVFSEFAEYQGRSVGADQCRRILQRAIMDNREYLEGLL